MATVKELLRADGDGTLSFGDYTLPAKTKLDNFEFEGDIYKVKTFKIGPCSPEMELLINGK